ncbi:MAG: flagellar protein export ATPase FliI [Candidatus Auribacter fodinae]|jgi:flagellum-specific ATP synthase|uniref:Flagellar protein export ATPase FliI n=1 Tax=Candidatus Auribacter fodinae TaxID=2093366 RepID=A0A3A4R8Z9_9BACT|nr:MAG: flagellar protein export ATPase FliI [Candidatus Auribacter fodinae]
MGTAACSTAITAVRRKITFYAEAIQSFETIKVKGKVSRVLGLTIESSGPKVSIGDMCTIERQGGLEPILAEVVGLKENTVLLMPLDACAQVSCGDLVNPTGIPLQVPVGYGLLGRIVDGMGNPLDNKGDIPFITKYPVYNMPPNPMTRRRITEPIGTGIRAIDGMITIGKGQRIGIFAGSGVGKSVLMGMIAKYSEADVNVIALIGERGRELRDFIEHNLGEEGLRKSVIVVATSDQPALIRLKGALVAHAIAEFFRDQGHNVMLMMDSVTRFAMAQREIGLSVGEPPTSKGYTPSVFAMLPALLERSGTAEAESGTITALYTVLVESDDFNEPIADAVRAILDGHIVLSRDLAASNHYPAIDVLSSVSRLFSDIASDPHKAAAGKLRDTLATYRKAEDLINIGAYVKGSNPKIDYAIKNIDTITAFLKQGMHDAGGFNKHQQQLVSMFQEKK